MMFPKDLLHQSVEITDSVLEFQVDSLKIANPIWVCVYILGGPKFLKNMFRLEFGWAAARDRPHI